MKKFFIVILFCLICFASANVLLAAEDANVGTNSVIKLKSDKDTALADGKEKIRISFGAFYTKDASNPFSVGASSENPKPICSCFNSQNTTCDSAHPLVYSAQNRITFTVSGSENHLWHPVVGKEMSLYDPFALEVEKAPFFDQNGNSVESQRYAFWHSFNDVEEKKILDCSTGYLSFDLMSTNPEDKTITLYQEFMSDEGITLPKSYSIKVNFNDPDGSIARQKKAETKGVSASPTTENNKFPVGPVSAGVVVLLLLFLSRKKFRRFRMRRRRR